MKSRFRIAFVPYTQGSSRSRVGSASPASVRRIPTDRLPSLSLVLVLARLLFPRPGVCQDTPGAVSVPGSVTREILETKIQEVEATAGMEEQAKTKLVELYRKALSNLQNASANAQAAEDFRRAEAVAPQAGDLGWLPARA